MCDINNNNDYNSNQAYKIISKHIFTVVRSKYTEDFDPYIVLANSTEEG